MSKHSPSLPSLSTFTRFSLRTRSPHLPIPRSSLQCSPAPNPPSRSFSTTFPFSRKQGGKGSSKNTIAVNASKVSNENPLDFSALENEIERVVKDLREEVQRIRPGGLNIDDVENARVQLKGQTGNAGGPKGRGSGREKGQLRGDVVKVGDLCQIVQRGRVLVCMVGEKD
ncbi:MAG: hypothetical protein Q9201_002949, partial [Fulgogasparrea decipioides]